MSASVPIGKWQAPAAPIEVGPRGLEPEVLLEHGILGDPDDPDDALRRARGLAEQGHYREARSLLLPHANQEGGGARDIAEILALCALRMNGAAAAPALEQALEAHLAADELAGAARLHRHLGELHLAKGELRMADSYLRDAAAIYVRLHEPAEGALVECARAQGRLRAGYLDRALRRVERALSTLAQAGQPRAEALARLDRARILANQGQAHLAARDLLAAERHLGVSGNQSDRVHVRLTRAETLVATGELARAANGLKRLLTEVVDLDDSATCAMVHLLLGQALTDQEPVAARRHLMRARHLYEGLRHGYFVTACDIALGRVEARMGLNPRSRLAPLTDKALAEWPLLMARLWVARAEMAAAEDPEGARRLIYRARGFAIDSGNRALLRDADRTLFARGLAQSHEVEELTPVDDTNSVSVLTLPSQTVPVPLSIAEDDECQVTERPDRAVAERLVSPMERRKSAPSLPAPRPMGTRRG